MELVYKEEVYDIVGAAMEVHRELGNGFLEAVYHEALAAEFVERGIPFEREKNIQIFYKGVLLKKYYQADFVCHDKIILELKALSSLNGDHSAQLLNYLKATGFKLGLLINFGQKSLVYKRLIF